MGNTQTFMATWDGSNLSVGTAKQWVYYQRFKTNIIATGKSINTLSMSVYANASYTGFVGFAKKQRTIVWAVDFPATMTIRNNAGLTAWGRAALDAYQDELDAAAAAAAAAAVPVEPVNINDSYSLKDLAEFPDNAPVSLIQLPDEFTWVDDNTLQIDSGTFQFRPADRWAAEFTQSSGDQSSVLLVKNEETYVAGSGSVTLMRLQHVKDDDSIDVWEGAFTEGVDSTGFVHTDDNPLEDTTVIESFDVNGDAVEILQYFDNIETDADESYFRVRIKWIVTASATEYQSFNPGLGNIPTLQEAQTVAQAAIANVQGVQEDAARTAALAEGEYEVISTRKGGVNYSLKFVGNKDVDGVFVRQYSVFVGTISIGVFTAADDAAAQVTAEGIIQSHQDELELARQKARAEAGEGGEWVLWLGIGVIVLVLGFAIYRGLKDGGE